MAKHPLSDIALAAINNPGMWKIVSSFFKPEIKPDPTSKASDWKLKRFHSHSHREILIALSGTVPFGAMEDTFFCPPGTVVFFDPHIPHESDYPRKISNYEHIWISIVEGHWLIRLVFRTGDRVGIQHVYGFDRAGIVSRQWRQIVDPNREACSKDVMRLKITGFISSLLAWFLSAYSKEAEGDEEKQLELDPISVVIEHIKKTCGKDIDLNSLARIAGYSKYHFHRMFMKHTGMTTHQYIDQCRKKKTAELLEKGFSKTAIADEFGFSSLPSFLRWYKKQFE